ncbi:MAG: cytochrome c peroxidase [Flavobacteriales bacterium]|jgi:cytochrome c peroxidase
MKKIIFFMLFIPVVFFACKKDDDNNQNTDVEFDDTPYVLEHSYFPAPDIAEDNQLTIQGVKLGRMLFYDKALSNDNSLSCAGCHAQGDAFSDTAQFSIGVEGLPGGRQAMAIFNMAWHGEGFFWDGRAPLLRNQSILPIQDPLEMNETLDDVIAKLGASERYRDQFTRAFGNETINPLKISLALEQFMNSIVSVDSKYDQYLLGQETLTESEERGRLIFFTEFDPSGTLVGGECFHCHAGVNFANNEFMNNGLEGDGAQEDVGLFDVTDDPADMAKFKVPSLRNIAVSPPFMHDGRFATLQEVVEHYNSGVQASATVDELMQYNLDPGLGLTQENIDDLVAFMHTLTDQTFLSNPEYDNPF